MYQYILIRLTIIFFKVFWNKEKRTHGVSLLTWIRVKGLGGGIGRGAGAGGGGVCMPRIKLQLRI